MDRRLGEIYGALDGNDVLVVMSDHGIRTALQHDPQAIFLAAGGGIGPGRLPGQPEIRGVPRMIADYFGVDTSWPATGVEAWVQAGAPDRTASAGAPGPRPGAALTGQQR
jgi:phosphopentomutase